MKKEDLDDVWSSYLVKIVGINDQALFGSIYDMPEEYRDEYNKLSDLYYLLLGTSAFIKEKRPFQLNKKEDDFLNELTTKIKSDKYIQGFITKDLSQKDIDNAIKSAILDYDNIQDLAMPNWDYTIVFNKQEWEDNFRQRCQNLYQELFKQN